MLIKMTCPQTIQTGLLRPPIVETRKEYIANVNDDNTVLSSDQIALDSKGVIQTFHKCLDSCSDQKEEIHKLNKLIQNLSRVELNYVENLKKIIKAVYGSSSFPPSEVLLRFVRLLEQDVSVHQIKSDRLKTQFSASLTESFRHLSNCFRDLQLQGQILIFRVTKEQKELNQVIRIRDQARKQLITILERAIFQAHFKESATEYVNRLHCAEKGTFSTNNLQIILHVSSLAYSIAELENSIKCLTDTEDVFKVEMSSLILGCRTSLRSVSFSVLQLLTEIERVPKSKICEGDILEFRNSHYHFISFKIINICRRTCRELCVG
jgi:hypothetical protein